MAEQEVNPTGVSQRVAFAFRITRRTMQRQRPLILLQRALVVAFFVIYEAQVVQRDTLELQVMDFARDGDGLVEMTDRLGVIASLPVDQAYMAESLALFQPIAQLLFHFQGATKEVQGSSAITQMFVAVADEAERDRLAMSVLVCAIGPECFLVLRQRG